MPEKPELSYKQTLQMRRSYLGKSVKLHFDVKPVKLVRGSRQYLYDDSGNEYLDCISNVSHVGHCHPHVVHAGQEQMAKLTTCSGFLNEKMVDYCKRIIATLPDKLCVCYFLNSGCIPFDCPDLKLHLCHILRVYNSLTPPETGTQSSKMDVQYCCFLRTHIFVEWM